MATLCMQYSSIYSVLTSLYDSRRQCQPCISSHTHSDTDSETMVTMTSTTAQQQLEIITAVPRSTEYITAATGICCLHKNNYYCDRTKRSIYSNASAMNDSMHL